MSYQSAKAFSDLNVSELSHPTDPSGNWIFPFQDGNSNTCHLEKWKWLQYGNRNALFHRKLDVCPLQTSLFFLGRPIELQFLRDNRLFLGGRKVKYCLSWFLSNTVFPSTLPLVDFTLYFRCQSFHPPYLTKTLITLKRLIRAQVHMRKSDCKSVKYQSCLQNWYTNQTL